MISTLSFYHSLNFVLRHMIFSKIVQMDDYIHSIQPYHIFLYSRRTKSLYSSADNMSIQMQLLLMLIIGRQIEMKAETNLLPTQPLTHLTGRHCRERFLCEDYALTHEQLQGFYALKEEANILFQQEERWDLVTALYTEYFQQPGQRSGKEWMRLGFQGQYPETDFRGGGVLSLQLILRFVKRNRPLVQVMETDKAGFFFAITAINIAFFLKKYFHLADFLLPGKDQAVYCNRRALKNFCRLLVDSEWAYFQIHEQMLKHFYNRIWIDAERDNSQTLLQFNALFEQLLTKLRNTFEDNNLENLGHFNTVFGVS